MTIERQAPERRFQQIYAEHGRAVLAYAVRRMADTDEAADVVADTFMVAWRRLDSVPDGDETRLWLYGVARRVSANHARSEQRRERLAQRLRRELPAALREGGAGDEGGALSDALLRLAPEDQEVLRLAAWEELDPSEIATVLGVSPVAARSRLHRARRRLHASLRSAPTSTPSTPLRLGETK